MSSITDNYIESDDDDEQILCSGSDSDENDISNLISTKVGKKRSAKSRHGDFDKEMSEELDSLMRSLTTPCTTANLHAASTSNTGTCEKKAKSVKFADEKQSHNPDMSEDPQYYDDIYFDTDDSSGDDEIPVNIKKKKEKRKFLSNDELLYDPKLDDEDQAWVDESRRSYQGKPNNKLVIEGKTIPLPESDAVLNCPACFTTLCHDCQRHTIYKNQYRAMFVFNCRIDFGEKLHIPKKRDKRGKQKQKGSNDSSIPKSSLNDGEEALNMAPESLSSNPEDIFFPVFCTICNTKVGVYDQDEVYHFFNILTSY